MKKFNTLMAAALILVVAGAAIYFDRKEHAVEVTKTLASPSPQASSLPVVWSPLGLKSAAELVIEIYKVAFEFDLKDQKLILQYADAMTQGASLEGIYNGLVHSAFYRELEKKNPGPVAPAALQYFAQELFLIESALPEKSFFSEKSAGPLPRAMDYAELEMAATKSNQPQVEASHAQQSSADLEQIFKNSSIFTLKRILSDELLKQIAILAPDKTALSNWYGRFASRQAGFKIDFGIALRNRPEEEFHRKWAESAPQDRLTWESLNRIHRVLNAKKR